MMGKSGTRSEKKKPPAQGPISRFFTQDGEEAGQASPARAEPRTSGEHGSPSRTSPGSSPASEASAPGSDGCDPPDKVLHMQDLPTKSDLAGMFQALEHSLTKELSAFRSDMAHLLNRVEESENRMDEHGLAIRELRDSNRSLALSLRSISYRLEDQENRNRRNNIRIRGLPEATSDSDLLVTVRDILNGILSRPLSSPLRFDRVHRALRPRNVSGGPPRDIICRLHYYEDKEALMLKLRDVRTLDFDGASLSFFPDLARETLERRRCLRPLLDTLRSADIPYRWGFPSCLIARREGKSHTLRYPEDLDDFCISLQITKPSLPGWQEHLPFFQDLQDTAWRRASPKQKRNVRPSTLTPT